MCVPYDCSDTTGKEQWRNGEPKQNRSMDLPHHFLPRRGHEDLDRLLHYNNNTKINLDAHWIPRIDLIETNVNIDGNLFFS